jgi:hypothetical protein
MARKSAKAGTKDTGVKVSRSAAARNEGGSQPVAGAETEVLVRGRVASATIGNKKREPQIVQPDNQLARDGKTKVIRVKAIRVGEYGHKRRRVGEVFDIHTNPKAFKELPSWVIDLEDAEVGQDEGTRGIHSGGRQDDELMAEREERPVVGKKSKKIVDPTIVEDAIPLSEGGNERKPSANEKVV